MWFFSGRCLFYLFFFFLTFLFFFPSQRSELQGDSTGTVVCWMSKMWKPVASVKSKWQFVCRGNDRHEYTLTANTIIQRTCNTSICSDRAHTPSHPWAHASTEITQVLSCFVASVYSAGCVHHTTTGGEWRAWGRQSWGGWGGGGDGCACWSWRVESICIWHTDCSKYANRQTMTFAVLFFLWYCSLSVKSTKRWACVLSRRLVRVLASCTCQVRPSF